MTLGVGLRIGSVVSTAVVAANDPGSPDPFVVVHDTVLYVYEDGATILGAPVSEGDNARTLSGFLARVGDPGGVSASDGSQYRAEDVVAAAILSLLGECQPLPEEGGRDGGAPAVMASYPSRWDSTTLSALRDSLDYRGLSHVSLVSDAEAAAAWFESEVADKPGQLVGIYHIDDTGATVTLVRSGVTAGHPFQFPSGSGTSPTAQMATVLGAFGWLPENLDAVVVMGDGLVARDLAAVKRIADTLMAKFGVLCIVGPGPEQTSALGAAILAAGFTPATHSIARIGLPPSYDVTEVLAAISGSGRTAVHPAITATEPPRATEVVVAPAPDLDGAVVPATAQKATVDTTPEDDDQLAAHGISVATGVATATALLVLGAAGWFYLM